MDEETERRKGEKRERGRKGGRDEKEGRKAFLFKFNFTKISS